MQKVLVIGSLSTDTKESLALGDMANFVDTAINSTKKDNAKVFFCHLDEIGYVFDNQNCQIIDLRNNCDLKDYSLVFFRGKLAQSIQTAATASEYLKDHKVPYVNTAYGTRRAVGKVSQIYYLTKLNLPIPKTVSASSAHMTELVADQLDFPFILKDVKGAHGNNNYLVKNQTQFKELLKSNAGIEFMAQEFVPNDGDYRILFVGNNVKVILRQGVDESHLNNTSAGAKASLVEVSSMSTEIMEQAKKFAVFCNYEIAGVDVIINNQSGEHYFLEINSQPQLASGAFVDLKRELLGIYFSQLLDHSE